MKGRSGPIFGTLVRSSALLLAVLAVSAAGGAAAEAAASPRVTGFVAVTNGSGSDQLSSFDLAGGSEKRLTSGPADHHYPALSADGRGLLFVGNDEDRDEIYRLDLGTPNAPARQVTAPPLFAESPAWAPDGRSIAYSAILTGWPSYQIFVARPDGNRPIQVTHDTLSGNSQPAFSPDSRRIAYIKGRAREDQIWVMDVDGSRARPLTTGPLDAYPAWLDDDTVMFAREDPTVHRSTVMAVRLDGSEPFALSPPSISVVEPRPMPDGRIYGATAQLDGALHLVTIARSDGQPIAAADAGDFVIKPIGIATSDGNVFTMSWITTRPAPSGGGTPSFVPFLVAALGLAGVAAAGVATYRARST
jgi:TolB protein